MDQIGSVKRQDQSLGGIQKHQGEKKQTEEVKEPKDKVEISKARDIFEKVIGSPVAVVNSAVNAAGGVISGGISGVEGGKDAGSDLHPVTSGAGYIALGATAGLMLVGGWIPAVVGGAVGLTVGILAGGSGSTERVGKSIDHSVEKHVSDNEDSGRKLKDGVRDFVEGAFTGAGVGAVEGFVEGTGYGAGVVSGVIEGTKGVASAALGKYQTSEPKEEKPKNSLFKKIIRIPRNVLGAAVGIAGGVTGMALNTIEGAIKGVRMGASETDPAHRTRSTKRKEGRFHGFMIRSQTALAGGVAGFMMGGPLGAGVGVGAGLISGQLILRAERKSGMQDEMMDNFAASIKHVQKDNTYNSEIEHGGRDKNAYETFRDGIEGAMTGTATGAREGFRSGYAAGRGVVDGVFDGVSGIIGAFTGK